MNGLNKKLILVMTVALAFLLMGMSGCDQGGKNFARGYELYKANNYSAAVPEFTQSIQINPNHPASYDYRGRCYVFLKQYDKAITDLNTAIAQDPKDATNYYYRGYAFYMKGLNSPAIADFNKVLQLSSDASMTQFVSDRLAELGQSGASQQGSSNGGSSNGSGAASCTPGSATAQLTCIGKTGIQVGPNGCKYDCNDPHNITVDFNFR